MRCTRYLMLSLLAGVAGCAVRPPPRTLAAQPAPIATTAAPQIPFAGYGSLAVPPRAADGGYATPNHEVSAAATVWHLRAGLNVAALACRGPEEAAIVAGYNALLRRGSADFDRAYRALGREYGSAASFDAAMTRLYNYYALPPAQAGLCAAAQQVLADAALLPDDGLPGFAATGLAALDRPYTVVFTRQEAWLASRPLASAPTLIAAATVP